MAKSSTVFICQKCSYKSSKWVGKCPQCEAWNSFLEEEREIPVKNSLGQAKNTGTKQPLLSLHKLSLTKKNRVITGIKELDRALGGGLVSGSVVLLAGDPGIGKSTLVSQAIEKLGGVYVCAEESPEQIKLRWQRLGFTGEKVNLIKDNNVNNILATLKNNPKKANQKLLVVDSIQTVFTANLRSSTGSASQVKECANILLNFAKSTDTTVFIVGHITKQGTIAGPKILEHLVDTVFYLSGDKNHQFRILTSVKNRFGAVDEVGIFRMGEKGLESVSDPSKVFLQQSKAQPGSCLTMVMQGMRPLVVEVQALCVKSKLAMPRRVAQGISLSKLQVLCAVLQKHLRLPLYEYDVFVSIAGGLKVTEPAIDLAVATAIYSSVRDIKIPKSKLYFGEVGLLGDVRPVNFGQRRVKEAKRLKFRQVICAETDKKWLKSALS